jgi:hypothetical protein
MDCQDDFQLKFAKLRMDIAPLHRKKRLATFPSQAGMSLTKLFQPRKKFDIPAEDGNVANLFTKKVKNLMRFSLFNHYFVMQEEMSLCMMMRSSRTEPPDLQACVIKSTDDIIGTHLLSSILRIKPATPFLVNSKPYQF